MPADSFGLVQLLGPDDWLHALGVERKGLGKVEDVEADPGLGGVLDREVEPLLVRGRVGVQTQDQLVLALVHSGNVQIARLKVGVEGQPLGPLLRLVLVVLEVRGVDLLLKTVEGFVHLLFLRGCNF